MDTLPLDLDSVLGELSGADTGAHGMPTGTRIGHVHLNVADLSAAEDFYAGALGFDVTVRSYPGALFLSTGGYHHQIGVNTWAGEGAPAPPPGSLGLRRFELALPGAPELEQVERRLSAAGFDAKRDGDALHLADPSGNGILLRRSSARGGPSARQGRGNAAGRITPSWADHSGPSGLGPAWFREPYKCVRVA